MSLIVEKYSLVSLFVFFIKQRLRGHTKKTERWKERDQIREAVPGGGYNGKLFTRLGCCPWEKALYGEAYALKLGLVVII